MTHTAKREGDGVYSYRACWIVRIADRWLISEPGSATLKHAGCKNLRAAKREIDDRVEARAPDCPECAYEVEHGKVGPYDKHTCDES